MTPLFTRKLYCNLIRFISVDVCKIAESTVNSQKVRMNPIRMKIDTPEFHSVFTDGLRTLISIFQKYNYELRIAGGAVRDILMEIQPKDIDLATTATPTEMKDMFTEENVRMINTKGERHGTITARIQNKENFEITTLRIDIATDGRHAEVQFTTDWQLDANRRDLTINSMFLDFDGTVYDYFNGYDDLQHRRILFVGDANTRIKEDYLRILRYFRFCGRIMSDASKHDENTIQAIKQNAEGLGRISGERIWTELQKIVIGNFNKEITAEIINCGLHQYCGLPVQPNLVEFQRVCISLSEIKEPHHAILYIIALMNSEEDAIRLHTRLKLSAYERDLALFITQHRNKVGKEYCALRDYQKLCIQPNVKRVYVEELLKYSDKPQLYESLKGWNIPNFPINGNILKNHGCPTDKRLGLVISQLKLIWADSDFSFSADELLEKYYPNIIKELPPSPAKKVRKSE